MGRPGARERACTVRRLQPLRLYSVPGMIHTEKASGAYHTPGPESPTLAASLAFAPLAAVFESRQIAFSLPAPYSFVLQPVTKKTSLKTTRERSELMKRVRQKDTAPEQRVRTLLRELGFRYRTNVRGLPGRPDIAHSGRRKAVFVNGCYWHRHAVCGRGRLPKANSDFWGSKFRENRLRDQRKVDQLRAVGFDVLVVWECELSDLELLTQRLRTFWRQSNGLPSRNGHHRPSGSESGTSVETFTLDRERGLLARQVLTSSGEQRESFLSLTGPVTHDDLAAEHDLAWLRLSTCPLSEERHGRVSIIDLFSGCGAMTAGAMEACRALQLGGVPALAVDTDEAAGRIYKENYPEADVRRSDINELLPGRLGQATRPEERRLFAKVGEPDLLLGGPPCQGHSDLNNHTRRSDPKNLLFMKMARCAEILSPTHIIVENVQGVFHDSEDVFARTCEYLDRLDYEVDWGVLKGEELGVPQRRHRIFLVASRTKKPDLIGLSQRFARAQRSVDWAIRDLLFSPPDGEFDEPSVPAAIAYHGGESRFIPSTISREVARHQMKDVVSLIFRSCPVRNTSPRRLIAVPR